ncbi:MAG: hypothetical protein KGI08_11260 [Thaumarchaeota archaeon]|nr:hypothetical protein [Nitrososphaerota archaeon]
MQKVFQSIQQGGSKEMTYSLPFELKSNCQKKGCMKRANRIIKTTGRTQILLCEEHYEGFKK